jgi:thiol-disulfide isomerase/thioredoxin
MRRRAILTAAGALAGGTLAAVMLWRKPPAPPIATPIQNNEPVALRPFSTLVAVDPPRPLPAAAFTDANGEPHHLSEFAGRGLVVNLWATWCAPCVAEMPALQDFAKVAASDGILVLPLASDRGGKEAVQKFYAEHGITALPIWLDPKAEAAAAWGARGLPTTLIVDRQGREVGSLEGAIDWAAEATLAGVRKLVGKRTPA